MRRVELFFRAGGTKYVKLVEVDDDATLDDVDEMLEQWLWEATLADWRYVEEVDSRD